MDQKEVLKALRHLKVETGSLACLGCGHENSCSTKGCAVIRAAIEALEETRTTGDCISRQAAIEAIDAEREDVREAAREMSCLGAEHDEYIATLSLDHVRKRVEQIPAADITPAMRELQARLLQVTVENDTLLKALHEKAECEDCIHIHRMEHCSMVVACQLCNEDDCPCSDCDQGSNWEWSGARNSDKRELATKSDMPLTIEQLRKMRGKWVWIVSPDKDLTVSGWAYVGKDHVFTYWEYEKDALVGRVVYNICDYGAWLAYAYEPKLLPINPLAPEEVQP